MSDTISQVKPNLSQAKMPISWEYYTHLIERLYIMIPKDKYKSISGIPRGGLIPAVMLSHYLDLKMVPITDIDKNTLIVDDICDTGTTLTDYKKYDVAVIFSRRGNTRKPLYVGQEIYGDEWLQFPYER